jgi:hypothetical protein
LELGEPNNFFLYAKRLGPGAFKHRGARDLRRLRRMADTHQLDVEIRMRVAFALRSRGICSNCRRRYDGWQLLFTSTRAVTLRH